MAGLDPIGVRISGTRRIILPLPQGEGEYLDECR